jgi:hypothetical protein
MKFGITKWELLALTAHLVALPSPNPEHGRKRLRAWDELGTAGLADDLESLSSIGGDIQIDEWRDKRTMHAIDLTPDTLVHLIAGASAQTVRYTDTLSRLRERLERLRDKTYELPRELRDELSSMREDNDV